MRILIVDDDEIFCRLLVEIFDGMGMETAWTTNGMTGYAMITDGDYDLCIIDVRMPLVLGTDLAEAIREDCPQVKIILLRLLPTSHCKSTRAVWESCSCLNPLRRICSSLRWNAPCASRSVRTKAEHPAPV